MFGLIKLFPTLIYPLIKCVECVVELKQKQNKNKQTFATPIMEHWNEK